MWTYNDDANLLPNIIIRSKFKDGILKHYQIYPVDGYVLRIPNMDEYRRDENGEYVLDENGEKILTVPYCSYGGAVEMPDYDWKTNPGNYHAELYEEGMIVF
ncbi:MAG: hypothetical protein KH216_11935 [Clostridiales bacterium]|nr:hypothetical protein [Clostridiales bacterium]